MSWLTWVTVTLALAGEPASRTNAPAAGAANATNRADLARTTNRIGRTITSPFFRECPLRGSYDAAARLRTFNGLRHVDLFLRAIGFKGRWLTARRMAGSRCGPYRFTSLMITNSTMSAATITPATVQSWDRRMDGGCALGILAPRSPGAGSGRDDGPGQDDQDRDEGRHRQLEVVERDAGPRVGTRADRGTGRQPAERDEEDQVAGGAEEAGEVDEGGRDGVPADDGDQGDRP